MKDPTKFCMDQESSRKDLSGLALAANSTNKAQGLDSFSPIFRIVRAGVPVVLVAPTPRTHGRCMTVTGSILSGTEPATEAQLKRSQMAV